MKIPVVGDEVQFQMNNAGPVVRGAVIQNLDADGDIKVSLLEDWNGYCTHDAIYVDLKWVNDLDEDDRTEFLFDITFNGDTSEFHGTLEHAKTIGRFLKDCGFAGVSVTRTITEKVEF